MPGPGEYNLIMNVTTENFGRVLPKALIKRIEIWDKLATSGRIWRERCSKDGDGFPDEDLELVLRIIISAQTTAIPVVPGEAAHSRRDIALYGDSLGLLHDPTHSKLPYRIILMLVTSAAEMDKLKRDNSYVREQIRLMDSGNEVAVFSRQDLKTVGTMRCSKTINDGDSGKVYYEDFEYLATVTAPVGSKSIPYLGLYCTTAYYDPSGDHPIRGESIVMLGEPNIQRIIVNDHVPLTSQIFHLGNKPGTSWAGPIHWSNHSLMARENHIPGPHPTIYPETVSNQKICDFRLLRFLTPIFAEDDQLLRKPGAWLTEAPNNLFSPLYISTTRKGLNRLVFNVNLKNIALSNASQAPKFANMDALRDCFKISGVEVTRHSLRGKEAQRLRMDDLVSDDMSFTSLVASVRNGNLGMGNVEFQSSDHSYGSANPDILTIIATEDPDTTDANSGAPELFAQGGGNYYSVSLIVEDHTIPALVSLKQTLADALNKFQDYWNYYESTGDLGRCHGTRPNPDNPGVKFQRESWIDLIDKYLSVLRFIKGEDIFCPEDINYFKKNLTTLVNPYALDNFNYSSGYGRIRKYVNDALYILTDMIAAAGQSVHYNPAAGLADWDGNTGIASFEIAHAFQNGFASEPAHGHTEITGYSYLNNIFVTDNATGLASVGYSDYEKRVNQEVLRFSDVNAAKVNTYGFLSPLHIEYSVGSDNRVIINDLTPVDQLFDLLQARFDPMGSVAEGNPKDAKQTVFEYSSATVKKLKPGRLRKRAGSANLDGQNQLINPDTGRPYGSKQGEAGGPTVSAYATSTSIATATSQAISAGAERADPSCADTCLINPDTGQPYSNNDDTHGDADSADYVGSDSQFVHQDGDDDQDSDSPTETSIADQKQTSALSSQPATMMLLMIAYQGSLEWSGGPPEYLGSSGIAGSIMAQSLTLLQNPNEYTVAFSSTIGDASSDDSNIGSDITKLYANSVAGDEPIRGTLQQGGCVMESPEGLACDLKVSNATRIGSYLYGSILGKSFGNPMWFDLRYNNVVRVEYQNLTSTSGWNNNEGWELLTRDIFNMARDSKLPLLCRMVTAGSVTTNAIPWSTVGFNGVFILGDTFVTSNTHHTRYAERIRAYIAYLKKVNTITDVKRINIGSEYLCDSSMIFSGKKNTYASVLPAGKRSHTTSNRLKRLYGAQYTAMPARTRSGRTWKAKFQPATSPVAVINPDTGRPYGSSR